MFLQKSDVCSARKNNTLIRLCILMRVLSLSAQMMYINFYLILTMLCTSACLQASQVALQEITHNKQATHLELLMIQDAANGSLTREKLQKYLKLGTDINAKDNSGATGLIYASAYGYTAIVQQFIAAGADINAKTNCGLTALIYASAHGNTAVVQQLIAAGSDQTIVNEQDNNKTARDYTEPQDEDVYDKTVAAGLQERENYFARQQHAKNIVAEQATHIPGLQDIIMAYAYGPSHFDLPETKSQSVSAKKKLNCVVQ